ncbi:hypothetical protein BGX26_010586 [Mortierella sp. AD094]|nr:hypothetical protein BGX26_010586 [Mortierella sp. AD094]
MDPSNPENTEPVQHSIEASESKDNPNDRYHHPVTTSTPSQPSSPTLSHIPHSPPPPAFRIHNPHTLPTSQQRYVSPETAFRNNDVDEKWLPAPPDTPFHLDRLNDEKPVNHDGQSTSPSSHSIQPFIAPTSGSYSQPATFSPSRTDMVTSSSRPTPNDLEMQPRSRRQQSTTTSGNRSRSGVLNRGGAGSSSNIQSPSTSHASTRRQQRGDTGNEVRRKRTSDISGSRRRTSDSTVAVTWEGGRRAGSPASSARSAARNDVRDAPSRRQHLHNAVSPPPPASQKRFSLFRRTLESLDISDKSQRAAEEGRGHSVSWARHNNPASARRSLSLKVPYYSGYGEDEGRRKTGIPGRNGEEPETNLLNFVDIMVNMPNKPKLNQVVNKLLKILAIMTMSYFLLMALYFAAEYQSSSHLHNISILVVDLDHSMIGNEFLNFTQRDNIIPGQVNWSIQTYKNIASVISDVENGNYWGAMVVRPNASWSLNKAASDPQSGYDPTKAFLFIYDGGRDPLAVKPYVVASMYTQFLQFTAVFNPGWVSFYLQYADSNKTSLTPLTAAPQVLGTPVAFEELDLHPPTATIITSATSVAYIWIFLIAGGSTYLVAHAVQPIARYSSVKRTMTLLLLPLLAFLSSLSMTYTILLLIFGVPFSSAGQFISLFLGMLLLQAAVASLVLFLIFLIPVTFIPIFTITFVVMNVIAVFNPVELMPGFYRWVYAMPFLNAVQMARFVLMGSYNRLGYNITILFAWILVPITLLPFAIIRQKRLMAEIMEIEEYERRQYRQKGYTSDKQGGYRHNVDKDYDAAWTNDSDKAIKRGRRSEEVDRRRPSRSRHYRNEDLSKTDQYYNSGDENSEAEFKHRRHNRRRNYNRRDNGSEDGEDNYDNDDEYTDTDDDGGRRAAANASRLIRPLNPRTISTGAVPSAPPESQVFDTLNRPFVEMPKLSRHPYASELARPPTPDEIK